MGARMADQGQGKPTEPRTACYVQVVCFADVRPGDHVWRLGSFREVHAAGEPECLFSRDDDGRPIGLSFPDDEPVLRVVADEEALASRPVTGLTRRERSLVLLGLGALAEEGSITVNEVVAIERVREKVRHRAPAPRPRRRAGMSRRPDGSPGSER